MDILRENIVSDLSNATTLSTTYEKIAYLIS